MNAGGGIVDLRVDAMAEAVKVYTANIAANRYPLEPLFELADEILAYYLTGEKA